MFSGYGPRKKLLGGLLEAADWPPTHDDFSGWNTIHRSGRGQKKNGSASTLAYPLLTRPHLGVNPPTSTWPAKVRGRDIARCSSF